jgi:hypothetical protein
MTNRPGIHNLSIEALEDEISRMSFNNRSPEEISIFKAVLEEKKNTEVTE